MDEFLKHWGYGTPLLYSGATYWLFHKLDTDASDEAKAAISSILKVKDYDAARMASVLLELFDRVYSRPLLSLTALFRSASITVILAIIFAYESGYFHKYPRSIGDNAVLISLLLNVVTDYISLFIIRKWLVVSPRHPVAALLGSTTAASCVVVLVAASRLAFLSMMMPFMTPAVWIDQLVRVPAAMFRFLFSPYYLVVPGVIVFAWLPLFGLCLLLLRTIPTLSRAVEKVQWFLKQGKDRPLDAVGYIAGSIVFALAAAWQLFFKAAT
jgi:hypothetical protein